MYPSHPVPYLLSHQHEENNGYALHSHNLSHQQLLHQIQTGQQAQHPHSAAAHNHALAMNLPQNIHHSQLLHQQHQRSIPQFASIPPPPSLPQVSNNISVGSNSQQHVIDPTVMGTELVSHLDHEKVQDPHGVADTLAHGDPRFNVFRKLSKTLKPAVLLKSWQRICMLVAGIETTKECAQMTVANLEREIFDRYHGNSHKNIVGTVRRAMDDNLEMLAIEKFGIKFPKDKISYVQMTAGMPGHTIWRYYKELVAEVASKINLAYRQCLKEDLTFPEGKGLFDVIEDTLRLLWSQNEDIRKERVTKRADGTTPGLSNDSESEHDRQESGYHNDDVQHYATGRKRLGVATLLNPKPFPGVDDHLESAPSRPRLSQAPARSVDSSGIDEDTFQYSPHGNNKRFRRDSNGRTESSGMQSNTTNGALSGVHNLPPGPTSEDQNEAIRIFTAETQARAQRLEELKFALSLFPDEESLKLEFKQFIDTARTTSLTNEALARVGLQNML